jgi:hypothetical protein
VRPGNCVSGPDAAQHLSGRDEGVTCSRRNDFLAVCIHAAAEWPRAKLDPTLLPGNKGTANLSPLEYKTSTPGEGGKLKDMFANF